MFEVDNKNMLRNRNIFKWRNRLRSQDKKVKFKHIVWLDGVQNISILLVQIIIYDMSLICLMNKQDFWTCFVDTLVKFYRC
jgi:hypothetical protein